MKLPQEQSLTVGGATYRLSKFDINLAEEFHEWAKSQLPDPFDGLAERVKGLPIELQREIVQRAEKKAEQRCTEDDAEYHALTKSIKGVKKMMHLLFRKHQPHLTEEQVAEIVAAGIEEKGGDFLAECFPEVQG